MVGQGQWTPQAPETGTKVGDETKSVKGLERGRTGGRVTIRKTALEPGELSSQRSCRAVVLATVCETMRWPLL